MRPFSKVLRAMARVLYQISYENGKGKGNLIYFRT